MSIQNANPVTIPAKPSVTYSDWAILRLQSNGTGINGKINLNYRLRQWGVDTDGNVIEDWNPANDKEFYVDDLVKLIDGSAAVPAGTNPPTPAVPATLPEPLMGVGMQLLVAVVGYHASLKDETITLPAGYLGGVCDAVIAELNAIKPSLAS